MVYAAAKRRLSLARRFNAGRRR